MNKPTIIKISFLWVYFLIGWIHYISGQNLVPNPSFENMKKFPSCQVTLPKDTFDSYIYDWIMPTEATPDIFSTLVNSSCISSPYSTNPPLVEFPIGHRSPRTENNFAGIAPFTWYREYLEVRLTSPLVPGQVYCCEMYVSRNAGAMYAQDCIGMYFSDNLIDHSNMEMMLYPAQITCDSIIEDSVNWVRISGSFKATSPAQYLTIGNFCILDAMQISDKEAPGAKYPGTYYYIDDVSVEKLAPPPLTITGNTTICPGEQLNLTATGRDKIIWVDINTGKYFGYTNNLQTIPKNGVKSFLVKSKYCKWDMVDTIHITYNPVPNINLGNDTLICHGTSLQLEGGVGQFDYLWQDSSTSETFTASSPGTYSVNVSNSFGCKGSDKITIGFYQTPSFSLGEDLEQCTPIGTLSAYKGHNYEKYLWQDGSTNATFDYHQEGTYWVKSENPCGMFLSDTIHISKVNMFVPNLITPNSDGLNDEFKITGTRIGKGSLAIYNRLGNLVYNNSHYENDWEGTHLTPGIYYYVFIYPTCEDRKGWIEVVK